MVGSRRRLAACDHQSKESLMDQHVIALFYQPQLAARAVKSLVEAGVELGEISLFATETGASECRRSLSRDVAEGAVNGGATGGALALGGTLLATGAGGAAIVAAGPLLLLAMTAFGFGTTVGAIVAALTKVGVPEAIATHFDLEVRESGAVLLGVSTLRHGEGPIAGHLRRNGGASVMTTASPIFAL
jgi:hypothetical protein